MPCDKCMEVPLHERLSLQTFSRNVGEIDKDNTLYSIRHNSTTGQIEYQIPPSDEWIPPRN